jgi:Fe-S-cluster containining protein
VSGPRDDEPAFGTAAADAPVTRAEVERALRYANLAVTNLRDDLHRLAAQVVTLTDEVTRRLDGVEPAPAPPGTPARATTATVELAVDLDTPTALAGIQASDETSRGRVHLGDVADKYELVAESPPCDELLPLCHARCCTFSFALSTQDLDEGVIRWDYGQPYLIRQRASDGYCVHNHPDGHGCTVHGHRPGTCRTYTCVDDERVWLDYANRIPAPPGGSPIAPDEPEAPGPTSFDLVARARARQLALTFETSSVRAGYGDAGPIRGPAPSGRDRDE